MTTSPDRLTEQELADRAGTTTEAVRGLVRLGILEPEDGTFPRRDVMRARVVNQLAGMGIDPEAIGTAVRAGHLRLGYLEAAGRRHPRSERTFAEIAADIGVTFPTLERIYVAFGLLRPSPGERIREEDLEALTTLRVLIGAGIDEERVLRLARVWGDSARRMAQYLPHYFHTVIEEPFRARGLEDNDAFEAAIREVGLRAGRSGENLVGWLFRRHSEAFMADHQFGHVEMALELAGVRQRPPTEVGAAAFVDLSGFTRLTEESGDEVGAATSLALAQLVSEVAAHHEGAVVKLLGDGALLHFDAPGNAVRAALEIVASVESRGLPPAHAGVNAGPMLYDEGDYFGRTVNIAARIAAFADANRVFVGESIAERASEPGFELREVGAFELKGIARPVPVFEALATPIPKHDESPA